MTTHLKASLTGAHKELFGRMEIDATSGIVTGPYVNFAAYPYIGSRYGEMRKILIVGMDIGYDPNPGTVQSFEERRFWIEDANGLNELNPHMSGTCTTTMHFLQDQRTEWQRWLSESCHDLVPQALLNEWQPHPNPLSYIAFTNYYKFLLIGNWQRVQLDHEAEEDLLLKEARILEPEIIVMQSTSFRHKNYRTLLGGLSEIAKVFVGYHPSVRGEKRRLGNLLCSIQRWYP